MEYFQDYSIPEISKDDGYSNYTNGGEDPEFFENNNEVGFEDEFSNDYNPLFDEDKDTDEVVLCHNVSKG